MKTVRKKTGSSTHDDLERSLQAVEKKIDEAVNRIIMRHCGDLLHSTAEDIVSAVWAFSEDGQYGALQRRISEIVDQTIQKIISSVNSEGSDIYQIIVMDYLLRSLIDARICFAVELLKKRRTTN